MVSKNPKLTQKSTSITDIPSEEIEPCNEREHLGVKGAITFYTLTIRVNSAPLKVILSKGNFLYPTETSHV